MKDIILNFPTRPWRCGSTSLSIAAIAMLAVVLAAASAVRAAPLPGAIFTTDSTCSGVDLNIYGSKADVYIDGGPAHPGAASLPDGSYYVKVTAPDGTLLGTSVGSGNDTPFVVLNQEPASCYQLAAILIKASDSTPGYDDTPNAGGEYKVWVSTVATFDNDSTKTDNFKVREGGGGPGDTANLCVDKFYDANVNGIWDTGEVEIVGWQFTLFGTVGFDTMQVPHTDTPWCSVVDPDTYTAMEADALAPPPWVHTTDTTKFITLVAGQNGEIDFGNVCLGAGSGLTLGFWSNKNGQSLETASDFCTLDGLNLRNANGTDYNPSASCMLTASQLSTAKTGFNSWLLSANATNMAYMLSAQLAAMELNMIHQTNKYNSPPNTGVNGNAVVYEECLKSNGYPTGFITINALMTAANNELGLHGITTAGSPFRAYQECLKNALDDANNNRNFVQGSPRQCGTPNFPSN